MKMRVTIKFYVQNDPYNMCHTIFMLHFHAVASFDLTLTLPVLSISLLLTRHLHHPFSCILAGFGLAVVSGLVSAADKAIPSQI